MDGPAVKIIFERDRREVIEVLSDLYLRYAMNGVSISDTGQILGIISGLIKLLGGDKAIEKLSKKLEGFDYFT